VNNVRIKNCWRQWGLTLEGSVKADLLIEEMIALTRKAKECGSIGLLPYVLGEAIFRIQTLPERSAAFRESYLNEVKP